MDNKITPKRFLDFAGVVIFLMFLAFVVAKCGGY